MAEVLVVPADVDCYAPGVSRPTIRSRNRATVVDAYPTLQVPAFTAFVEVPLDVEVEVGTGRAAQLAVKMKRVQIARVGGAPQIRVAIDALVARAPEHLSDLAFTIGRVRVMAMSVRPLTYCGRRHCQEQAYNTTYSNSSPHRPVRVRLHSRWVLRGPFLQVNSNAVNITSKRKRLVLTQKC